MSTPLKVAYLGNYGEHNTESHVARALEYNGHEVIRVQENTPTSFDSITQKCGDVDFVLWTRTGWDWNHVFGSKDGDAIAHARQYRMLDWLRRRHIPSVAFHLDRWVDLDREYQIAAEPFFSCDLVITADGGNDDRFKALGINHYWMPPGVSAPNVSPACSATSSTRSWRSSAPGKATTTRNTSTASSWSSGCGRTSDATVRSGRRKVSPRCVVRPCATCTPRLMS